MIPTTVVTDNPYLVELLGRKNVSYVRLECSLNDVRTKVSASNSCTLIGVKVSNNCEVEVYLGASLGKIQSYDVKVGLSECDSSVVEGSLSLLHIGHILRLSDVEVMSRSSSYTKVCLGILNNDVSATI